MTVENASIFFQVSLIHGVMSIVFQFEFEINDRQTGAEKYSTSNVQIIGHDTKCS